MTRERESASPDRVDEGSNEEKDCKLCGLPVSSRSRSRDGEFCCEGCRRVHETLGEEVDLGTQGVDKDGFEGVRSETGTVEEPGKEAERDGSLEVSYLDVEGMHCVACEVFLEERVTELGGVETADVSYVTGMMKVVHDPDTTTRDDLVDAVSTTGYDAGVGDTSNRTSEDETRGVASNEVDASRLVVGVVFGMFSMMWYVTVLYPEYLGLWSLVDMSGQVGTYLLLNVWVGSTVVVFYAGYPILRSAYVSIRSGLPNMDLLIALAALSAYAYSTAALVAGSTELYYDVSVAVVLAVSIGRYYERRIRDRATRKLSEIADERVEDARVRD
ncbi:MAG: cation transporter, partial [Halobacteria archaeon]|nr:cation transporter [Halobacteria archaeon]